MQYLDVRKPSEYADGHIAGAQNAPSGFLRRHRRNSIRTENWRYIVKVDIVQLSLLAF